MEAQLREHLLEGEQLLWSGRPEPFETLDKTNKRSIIVGLAVKALAALAVLWLYIASARESGRVQPLPIALILAAAAYALARPFMTARRLRQKTVYGLTDRRVLRAGVFDEAIPYARIQNAVLRTDADGHTSLLCGPRAVPLKPRQWRGEADASFIDIHGEPEAARVILFALPKDERLRSVLEAHLPIR